MAEKKKMSLEESMARLEEIAAELEGEKLLTAGGRVLGVVMTAPTLKEAVALAYDETKKVHFENAYMRSDIGKKALAVLEEK